MGETDGRMDADGQTGRVFCYWRGWLMGDLNETNGMSGMVESLDTTGKGGC